MTLKTITLPGNLTVSVLGLGTMGMGGQYERDKTRDESDIHLLQRALEMGINLFDTAEVYAAGGSEEVLGQALQGRRDRAVIASKFKPGNSRRPDVIAACEASLQRLGTDYIDLYQTHWPNPAVPLEETMAGLQDLVEAGKVRAIGFSNATVAEVRKARALLPSHVPIASIQQEYSLIERFVERLALPFCQSAGMALIAYSPLAQGKLAAADSSGILAKTAAAHGLTPAAIALQWLARQSHVVPIPMTARLSNLEANVAALANPLPDAVLDEVGAAFSVTIEDLPVESIRVIGSHTGKAYTQLEDARGNTLNLSPSPAEVAKELADGEMLKPVKVRPSVGDPGMYDLYEGQLRYWAWRIAHDDRLPIPAQIGQ